MPRSFQDDYTSVSTSVRADKWKLRYHNLLVKRRTHCFHPSTVSWSLLGACFSLSLHPVHVGLQQIASKSHLTPQIHNLVGNSAVSRAAQATALLIISFLFLPSPLNQHHVSGRKYSCTLCDTNDVCQCTCNPIRGTMLLCNIGNHLYQSWTTIFSFSNHPTLLHLSPYLRHITKNKAPPRVAAPLVPTAPCTRNPAVASATDGETATLLSLVHLLRCKSGPLMELIRIAMDTEVDNAIAVTDRASTLPVQPMPCSISATTAIPFSTYEHLNLHHPSLCRRTVMESDRTGSSASHMLYNERRRRNYRSRSRSRSFEPECTDSNPDGYEKPPTFLDDGSAESRKPKYAWPFWYNWTATGAVRGRCSP